MLKQVSPVWSWGTCASPVSASMVTLRSSPRSFPFLSCVCPRSSVELWCGVGWDWQSRCCTVGIGGLFCHLGSGLPLWQTFPRTCVSQIWCPTEWNGQSQGTLTGKGITEYFDPASVCLEFSVYPLLLSLVVPPSTH